MRAQQKQKVFEWHENLLDPIPLNHPLQVEKLPIMSCVKYLLTPKFKEAIKIRTYFLRNQNAFKNHLMVFFNETILCRALMVGLSTGRKCFNVYHLSYLISSSPDKVQTICHTFSRSAKLLEYCNYSRRNFRVISSITEGKALQDLIKFVVDNERFLEVEDQNED